MHLKVGSPSHIYHDLAGHSLHQFPASFCVCLSAFRWKLRVLHLRFSSSSMQILKSTWLLINKSLCLEYQYLNRREPRHLALVTLPHNLNLSSNSSFYRFPGISIYLLLGWLISQYVSLIYFTNYSLSVIFFPLELLWHCYQEQGKRQNSILSPSAA